MHAITCPPLTNKEGKKRGAGNDTSFQLQHGQLQFWMVRWPFASSNENENEKRERGSRCSLLLAELPEDGLLDRGPL